MVTHWHGVLRMGWTETGGDLVRWLAFRKDGCAAELLVWRIRWDTGPMNCWWIESSLEKLGLTWTLLFCLGQRNRQYHFTVLHAFFRGAEWIPTCDLSSASSEITNRAGLIELDLAHCLDWELECHIAYLKMLNWASAYGVMPKLTFAAVFCFWFAWATSS